MSGHTPGPWRVNIADATDGSRWVQVHTDRTETPEEDVAQAIGEANARLIAAAPALRDALERCVTYFKLRNLGMAADHVEDAARAALAKVKP